MSTNRYERFEDEESGLVFVFKYDVDAPDLLHIYARHTTTPEEAVETFFGGETTWNAALRRFETSTDTHGLYWFWLEPDAVVMVVFCFRF